MVQKPFEELTIADDTAKQCTSCTLLSYEFSIRKLVPARYPCHPWQVMEHEPICKEFLEMSFTDRHPCLSVNTSFAVRQNIATAWNHRHPWPF